MGFLRACVEIVHADEIRTVRNGDVIQRGGDAPISAEQVYGRRQTAIAWTVIGWGGSSGFRDGRYKTSRKDGSYVAGSEWVGYVANAPFVRVDGILEVSPQDCPMLGAESS